MKEPHAEPSSEPSGDDDDAGACRKYLPAVGAVVSVPCEGATATDAVAEVPAPEQACDQLAGDAVDFIKLKESKAEAVSECRKAASAYPETRRFKFQLARALHVSGEYQEALQLYRPLADSGHARAMNNLGVMFEHGLSLAKDDAEAVDWFRKSAERGYARAQYNLGRKYEEGQGVRQDFVEAVNWYRKSSDQGFAAGEASLGRMYVHGKGVAEDDATAVALFRKAADQGFAKAQTSLGYMYAVGKGIKKDQTEAANWYRKAAEQHNAAGEFDLGLMYASGQGVAKDDAAALARWISSRGSAVTNLWFFSRRRILLSRLRAWQGGSSRSLAPPTSSMIIKLSLGRASA